VTLDGTLGKPKRCNPWQITPLSLFPLRLPPAPASPYLRRAPLTRPAAGLAARLSEFFSGSFPTASTMTCVWSATPWRHRRQHKPFALLFPASHVGGRPKSCGKPACNSFPPSLLSPPLLATTPESGLLMLILTLRRWPGCAACSLRHVTSVDPCSRPDVKTQIPSQLPSAKKKKKFALKVTFASVTIHGLLRQRRCCLAALGD